MRASTFVLTLSLCGLPLAAQQGDRGVFAIQRGGTPLGREEFTFAPGEAGATSGGIPVSYTHLTLPTILLV